MKSPNYKVKVGIIGCGAIGARMAAAIVRDFHKDCKISGLYDVDKQRQQDLIDELGLTNIKKSSIDSLIAASDCVVEAVNSDQTLQIIEKIIRAKKSVLAMSVGKLLDASNLFGLAKKNKCYILLPSGAIAGVDAIKAASLVKTNKIILTTRKPTTGFQGNAYLDSKGIVMSEIKQETVIFEGKVREAVRHFPQNINVAATIALACQDPDKLKIKIVVSPDYKKNIHEIELDGDFGKIHTRTENVVCPDNPKTSYMAVLSGLQTLKQYCTGILIGT